MRAPVIHAGPVWGPRLQTAFVFGGSALLALFAGSEVAEGGPERVTTPLLGLTALAGAIVLFSIPPDRLFLGWLFLAPLFQNAADESPIGRPLALALYLAPASLLVCHTLLRWLPNARLRAVDALPALFAAYVLGSMLLTTSLFDSPFSASKQFFGVTGIGVAIYYFVAFGPGSSLPSVKIVRALVAAALLQSLLSTIEWRTGWTVWGDSEWQSIGLARSVGTLSNPSNLGMFIGVGMVFALAVLAWDGPTALRRPSWLMLLVGAPGLLFTLTRAPVLATTIASVGVVLLGRRSRVTALGAMAAGALAIVLLWPTLSSSRVYSERVANRSNVDVRAEVQDLSLRLASQRPLTGWGYGSFDEVKDTVGHELGADKTALATTSHNAFLTSLVEYGGLGLSLLLVPWVVLAGKGAALARRPSPERWFLIGCLGALVVFVLTAMAGDFRYFSFAQMLPWLFVGLIRRDVARSV